MEIRLHDKAAIAKRFKALRRRSLMSQSMLGAVIGICRQSVNKIENRRVLLHYGTWDKFCGLEARHEWARALSRVMAAGFPPWRGSITKGDTK